MDIVSLNLAHCRRRWILCSLLTADGHRFSLCLTHCRRPWILCALLTADGHGFSAPCSLQAAMSLQFPHSKVHVEERNSARNSICKKMVEKDICVLVSLISAKSPVQKDADLGRPAGKEPVVGLDMLPGSRTRPTDTALCEPFFGVPLRCCFKTIDTVHINPAPGTLADRPVIVGTIF